MLLCTWILFSGLAFANPLQAQTVTVQGTVTDASGTAIPGSSRLSKVLEPTSAPVVLQKELSGVCWHAFT